MADRRMFAKVVTESDGFYTLSKDAQVLYLHFAMNADDDGLLNSPRLIMRNCNVFDDALKELEQGNYIICFESGVVALCHWHINNRIYKDRYKPTVFREEYSRLGLSSDNIYTLETEWIYEP